MEGEMISCYVDPNMLSVSNLKSIVVELGYAEHKIRKLHLRKPNVAFDKTLVPIENDPAVQYLM